MIFVFFGIFLRLQHRIPQDETGPSADREREKGGGKKKSSLISLSELRTQTGAHKEAHAEAGGGTAEVLWVAVTLLAASISV